MKKTGFTLSEVLITLGIIGVVGAMTIPTLLNNYKQRMWISTLKYDYALLNEGFRRMLATEGVDRFEMTNFFQEIKDCTDRSCSNEEDGAIHDKYMKMYFKSFEEVSYQKQVDEDWPAGSKLYPHETCEKFVGRGSAWYVLNDPHDKGRCMGLRQAVYRLANGSTIRMAIFSSQAGDVPNPTTPLTSMVGQLTIDTNANNGPNILGRDAFMFVLGQNGILYPYYCREYAEYFASQGKDITGYYWKYGADVACGTTKGVGSVGQGCAARIMDEGWKMTY